MRRRRKTKVMEVPQKSGINPGIPSGKSRSMMSWIKHINGRGLSGQLRGMADNLERFEQIAELMTYLSIFGGSSPGRGRGLNFASFLKNGDSLNHLFKAILPVFRNAASTEEIRGEPIKIEPISVETHRTKKG